MIHIALGLLLVGCDNSREGITLSVLSAMVLLFLTPTGNKAIRAVVSQTLSLIGLLFVVAVFIIFLFIFFIASGILCDLGIHFYDSPNIVRKNHGGISPHTGRPI